MKSRTQETLPPVDVTSAAAWATAVLTAAGVRRRPAELVARLLIEADLGGKTGHGLLRLPEYYRRLESGATNREPRMRVAHLAPSVATLNADNGLGQLAALRAMHVATRLALKTGCASVSVSQSSHLGVAGSIARIGAGRGMICVVASNGPPAVAAPGSYVPVLGTNPIAFAFPTEGQPVVADLATAMTTRGAVRRAKMSATSIPLGWALDRDGQPTTDPVQALEGTLLPVGGAKGFALGLAVELLTAGLAGGAMGPDVMDLGSPVPQDVSHYVLALRLESFCRPTEFVRRTTSLLDGIRMAPPIGSTRSRVPGQHAPRGQTVPLSRELLAELDTFARGTGLPLLER